MRSGKIPEANSIIEKVRKLSTRANANKFGNIRSISNAGEMWQEVKKLTGKTKKSSYPLQITPNELNNHYATISSDKSYKPPPIKITVPENTHYISEQTVFFHLNKLKKTAAGNDKLPFWFLRLGAAFFSTPLSHILNISLNTSNVPDQWKHAIIHPVPKVSIPTKPSEFRPISVLPILSRVTEKIIVEQFINPAMLTLPPHLSINNQYAYRPTSSTSAALIAMLSHITHLLDTNDYVHIISFDYSKAFDTLSHSSLAQKLVTLNLPDSVYNWLINYLTDRTHATSYKGEISNPASINASIVQGSALGPHLFNINSCDLHAVDRNNTYFKYADDAYLVVASSNSHTIATEINHHVRWAQSCNLTINETKTSEMIISKKGKLEPPLIPGIARVGCMKILGVYVDKQLSFLEHTDYTLKLCNQSLYALKTLKSHGLPFKPLTQVFSSICISRMLYAIPAWWGFSKATQHNRLEAFLRKATKLKYYDPNQPDLQKFLSSLGGRT